MLHDQPPLISNLERVFETFFASSDFCLKKWSPTHMFLAEKFSLFRSDLYRQMFLRLSINLFKFTIKYWNTFFFSFTFQFKYQVCIYSQYIYLFIITHTENTHTYRECLLQFMWAFWEIKLRLIHLST